MHKWADYRNRSSILQSRTLYWMGRDKWVNAEYRAGRMRAAFVIRQFREQMLTPRGLEVFARHLRNTSEYFRAGANSLLDVWIARSSQQHAPDRR